MYDNALLASEETRCPYEIVDVNIFPAQFRNTDMAGSSRKAGRAGSTTFWTACFIDGNLLWQILVGWE